jgi:hypothetical protein
MTNAWSLLYDYMNEDEYLALDKAYDAYLENVNTFNFETAVPVKPEQQKTKPNWKYHEDLTIKEIEDYITRTYSAHYSSKIQTLDLIESVGDAEAFCRSNILKYASRYDKKGSAKMDIMKIIHYAILLYHFSGQNNEIETPYETF